MPDPTTPAPELTAPTMLLLDKHKLQVAIGEFVYQRFQCGQERALAEAEGFMRHIPDSAYVANEYAAAERPAERDMVTVRERAKQAIIVGIDNSYDDPEWLDAISDSVLEQLDKAGIALAASSAEHDAALNGEG